MMATFSVATVRMENVGWVFVTKMVVTLVHILSLVCCQGTSFSSSDSQPGLVVLQSCTKDLNTYRMGAPDFYGPGPNYKVRVVFFNP